jgi:hypothetical protein
MKKYLEKIVHTVIPHKKNGDVPHILRKEFIIVLAVFAGLLFYFNQNNFNIIKNLNLSATVYPAVLADLANQDRATSGVEKLAWNGTLETAAKMKAEDMLKNGYFAHTSPAGLTPWYWLKEAKYNFVYAGENLAVDFTESANVETAWLNSPKHRENIMNSHFSEIGIATIDGMFEGKNTTFVVEFFGSPSIISATPEKPVTPKKVAVENLKPVTPIPTVAGASAENVPPKENIKVIEETGNLIVAKNENVVDTTSVVQNIPTSKPVSTWYERFIVSPANAIRIIYTIIFALVLIAVLLMLSKEYQKHHTKHLVMGMVLMFIISSLLYIVSTNSPQIFF